MVITTGTVVAGNRAVTSVAAEFRRSEGEAAGIAILESSERPGGSREAAEVVVTTGTVVTGTNPRGADQDAPVTVEEEGSGEAAGSQARAPGTGAGAAPDPVLIHQIWIPNPMTIV